MATHTIGIILNGATGRICSTQHLANALVPIRDEGGLPAGDDRIVPRLMLVGAQRRQARRRRQELWRGMDHRPRRRSGRSGIPGVLRRRRHAASARPRLRRRSAAGKHIYSEKPVALSVEQGWRCCAKRRRAGSSTARSRTSSICRACRSFRGWRHPISSAALSAFASSSAGGCSTAPKCRASGRAGTTASSDGGGLILDMFPHWRYVIENTLGPIRRVITALSTATPERIDERGAALRGRCRGQRIDADRA